MPDFRTTSLYPRTNRVIVLVLWLLTMQVTVGIVGIVCESQSDASVVLDFCSRDMVSKARSVVLYSQRI